MSFLSRIGQFLADDRLLFNIVVIGVLLGATLLVSFVLRRLLIRGSNSLARIADMPWLHGMGQEAARRARGMLFWLTVGMIGLVVAAGVSYHFLGHDIRADIHAWFAQLTWREVFDVLLMLGELTALGFACRFVSRQLRSWLPLFHEQVARLLVNTKEDALKRWFRLLERYAITMLILAAAWCAGWIVGLTHFADTVLGFLFRVITILSVSHLLILSCRTLSHVLHAWGDAHLVGGQFHRYWERITRLFPFGERCFEAAVYITATCLCVKEFEFIAFVALFGHHIVECIGIFFGTRVVIELVQVLLNEAFGIYDEAQAMDQKKLTLVPLLQSVAQYVLYFGAGVTMLHVLGIPTSPILAGAGILGLAGGLGAQSLVTDVVSGFFILFENQYLVGDIVKINDSGGRVEAVSIRTTQIRDDEGRLHIIPNGQIKGVINYSKVYVVAQVDIKLPADRNLDEVFRAMAEAGWRLRQTHKEVIGETVIRGLVDLGPNEMTVRATTKVQPGSHHAMQNEYRRLLKQVFDEQKKAQAAGAPVPAVAA